MTITVYRSDDAGAPLIQPTNNSFCALLKACLVDGYGAKSGAGWTVGAEDAPNNKIILSNSDGKHYWILHDAYATTNQTGSLGNFKYAFIKGIESFSDIDTHVGNYPNLIGSAYPDLTTSSRQAMPHPMCDAEGFGAGIPWLLVADDKTMHLYIQMTEETSGTLALDNATLSASRYMSGLSIGSFGLYGSRIDSNNGMLYGCNTYPSTTQNNYAFMDASSTNLIGRFLQRNYAGDIGAVEMGVYPKATPYGYPSDYFGASTSITNDSNENSYAKVPTISNELLLTRIEITDHISAQEHIVTPSYVETVRGFVPGIYGCYHQINSVATGYLGKYGDTFTSGGRTYILAAVSTAGTQHVLAIDITGPW